MKHSHLFVALILATGLALSGVFIYLGIHELATMNRVVTVKGLSTRDVKADFAVWTLRFTVNGDDLMQLQSDMEKQRQTIFDFLKMKGFASNEITTGNVNISNNFDEYYSHRPEHRYSISCSVVISTNKVDLVVAEQGCQTELLSQGVVLNSNFWDVNYQYNGLNQLKPEMIEEATKNARAVAQKFADDSHSRLGGITQANQGQFSIEDDTNQSWIKHVRVVTTVNYSLH